MPTVVIASFSRPPAELREAVNSAERAFLANKSSSNAVALAAALSAYEDAGRTSVVARPPTDAEADEIAAAQAESAQIAADLAKSRTSAHAKLEAVGLTPDEIVALAAEVRE